MRTFLPLVGMILAAALLVSEAAMQPTRHDRLVLYGVFASVAAASAAIGVLVARYLRRSPSVRRSLLVLGTASVAVAGGVVGAAAASMFLSAHDLRLVLVALGMGMSLGIALAASIARPLAADLERLAAVAERIRSGSLSARTGVVRHDEVGAAGLAMDAMAEELERVRDGRRSFFAAVSHDLRTPLTSLQAAVEALEDGVAPDPERYLRSMGRDLAVLTDLVDDLFLLAQIEAKEISLRLTAFDLTELAEEVREVMLPVADRRGVEVVLDSSEPASVKGDPDALGRVLRNLLDNAVRYAPVGTAVRIDLRGDPTGVLVRVTDEGPGFDHGLRMRALEAFSRADPARGRDSGGRGLGLTIARGLVEAHAGSLWIEPGQGGKVAFKVPVKSEPPGDGRSTRDGASSLS